MIQPIFKLAPDLNFLNRRYLNYYLMNSENLIHELATGGDLKNLYRDSLKTLKLQLPSLEIQKDIVEKLDRFTELSIDGELKKEILLRKDQYEYYREFLFNKIH